jgi:2',3'-cyclic-nucleotide 2'-phosphodiesterase (5'-nucleotidase family)
MKAYHIGFLLIILLTLLGACQDLPTEPVSLQEHQTETVTLTVLYTNDEHGWLQGEEPGKGAAELAGLWSAEYGIDETVLILSGGDNWTGPAISTWFEGESTVEVMNAMGYAASAVGNHEFDFGLDGLKTRSGQAQYAYLGANIRYTADGTVPVDLGIQPYVILEVAGQKVGLIGLANVDTPATTNPGPVSGFTFAGYAETLREIVPEVRAAGADIIFVPTHACTWELAPLARDVSDLGIALFGGGHCHEKYANTIAGSVVLSGGSYFSDYAYAIFEIDPRVDEILASDYGVLPNQGGSPHPQIVEIVSHWQAETDTELNVVIGYLETEIEQRSLEMAALITQTWLQAYPADFALTNWGGMRDRLPAGEITIANLISVMPFDNVLVDVTLTGEQLKKVLNYGSGNPPIGGIRRQSGVWIVDKTGEELDPGASYSLLVSDFLYAGGDDYTMLVNYDPDAYNTAISWRQPVIDWIRSQGSSPDKPVDAAVKRLLE